ncbi:ABC transporter permease [Plantactinospora sonchi]|uniref:ABC transporter permease n=1 Tax=Plantactinospora sonchi TaxID=1544735 RepID=A0ABU7RLA3_9ACTN
MNTAPVGTPPARGHGVRVGLHRGWIEFRKAVTSGQELWGALFFPVIALIVMYLLRGSTVPGTTFSLGSQAVPGILALNIVMAGMTGLAVTLTMDREDGTLLRAKAVPNGVLGYFTGRLLSRAGVTLLGLVVLLVPAALLFTGLRLGDPAGWLTLAWVLALGLAATMPIGAVIGALFNSTQGLSVVMLPIMLLTALSGIFYPVSAFPDWLQWIAQLFPIYWLGLGLRSALLPDALAAAEIGDSWRHLETVGALGVWAVAGCLLAPVLLRRTARHESGSRVAARQEKAVQRMDAARR